MARGRKIVLSAVDPGFESSTVHHIPFASALAVQIAFGSGDDHVE